MRGDTESPGLDSFEKREMMRKRVEAYLNKLLFLLKRK